jgi:5'-3' exonuclease
MKYAIVDLSNLFFSIRHVVQGDILTKTGMAYHIIFRSLKKLYKTLDVQHIVFAIDDSSWRYSVYPAYKGKRRLDRLSKTEDEQEEDKIFLKALNDLIDFLSNNTNCTVLKKNKIEADDFVAGWIQSHPNDEHIIVSADSDFVQLLDNNVKIYDGIKDLLITTTSITNRENKKVEWIVDPKNGKIKIATVNDNFVPDQDWWKYALFVKIVRGDAGDGILPSYPRIRYKGTSKKVGILEAWNDRKSMGYDWNNFMLNEWDKPEVNGTTKKVKVIDEFLLNESLIDLTKQPDEIKEIMFSAIEEAIENKKEVPHISMKFLQFCKIHELPSLASETKYHVEYLNKSDKK